MELNLTNYKITAQIMIELELEAWKKGDKKWTVSNQFDESVLESALENIDKGIEDAFKYFNGRTLPIMALAHRLADFEAPEIDSAWID